MPVLREKARQKYLGEREAIKLDELEAEIRDERVLFRDQLTKAEEDRLRQKQRLLELAREHQNLESKLKVGRRRPSPAPLCLPARLASQSRPRARLQVEGYEMPEQYVNEREQIWDRDKQAAVLKRRYEDGPIEEFAGNVEQKLWEEDLLHMAHISAGAAQCARRALCCWPPVPFCGSQGSGAAGGGGIAGAKDKAKYVQQDDYDLVIDEEITETFIKAHTLGGTLTEADVVCWPAVSTLHRSRALHDCRPCAASPSPPPALLLNSRCAFFMARTCRPP